MKRFGLVLLAALGLAGFAQAADLPTKKAVEAPAAKPNCFASFWDWLNASASDCPLTYAGITLYGTLDLDATYLHEGVGLSPSADKVNYGIQKNAYESKTTFAYNALSSTVVGLKMKEDLGVVGLKDWSLIGVLEAGVNPFSGMFFNGPRSLADNNFRPAGVYPFQTTNFDSSRAGQWDNSLGFIGISNPVYGTLTFGRTNSLSSDITSAYDPVASSAFSMIGFSSSFAGFGDTVLVRPNTAFTYRLTYQNFRAAGQAQIGSYALGNGSNGSYQGQLGADFGPLSLDGVVGWAKDAVSLSSYGGSSGNIATIDGVSYIKQAYNGVNFYYDPNTVLKATLSNNFGAEVVAKYKWDKVTFYGGYIYARLSNPSDQYAGGFQTISEGIFVPAGAANSSNYNFNRVLQTFWTGLKWSVYKNLTVAVGFYYQGQNNFNFSVNSFGASVPAACTDTGAFISSSKCGGSQDGLSLLIDYKPVGRVDIYGGVMLNNVYGGLANVYFSTSSVFNPFTKTTYTFNTARTQNYDPTVGIRIRF